MAYSTYCARQIVIPSVIWRSCYDIELYDNKFGTRKEETEDWIRQISSQIQGPDDSLKCLADTKLQGTMTPWGHIVNYSFYRSGDEVRD